MLRDVLYRLITHERALGNSYQTYAKSITNQEVRQHLEHLQDQHRSNQQQLEQLVKKYCSG